MIYDVLTKTRNRIGGSGLPIVLTVLFSLQSCAGGPADKKWPQYTDNPFVIELDQPPMGQRGGLIVHDLTGDGLLDYVVSQKEEPWEQYDSPATIGAYAHDGSVLWIQSVDLKNDGNAENVGLPGWSGPGIAAGDVDGDGAPELLHLDTGGRVVIRNGSDGEIKVTFKVALPKGATRWGQIQIVNLRGEGDRDLILQADPLPFNWLTAVRIDTGQILWTYNKYKGPQHGGFRACDIDGDGRDEVVGGTIIDDNGRRMNRWDYRKISGHFDSVFIYDVRPDVPGLEIVLLEESHEGDDRVALVSPTRIFFLSSRDGDEPQNSAVGEFDLQSPGLEIWNRSRFNEDQRPWVIDSRGKVIAEWVMNEVKPADWSVRGVEFIYSIDWDGGERQLAAAKERHVDGKVCVFDPVTGEFVEVWDEAAARVLVADVSGDYREEVMVVNSAASELHVYHNDSPNSNKPKPRYWNSNHYQRQKQNYNYYSP
ncbi:hypothetical protein ACFLT7_03535 [candidate division KSB1 bacterium]